MADKFYLSTGDLKQQYVPVGLVSGFFGVPAPAFGQPNYNAGFGKVTDQLVANAKNIPGANGLIWISFYPQWLGSIGGFVVFATGTAVKVTPDA